MFARLNLQHAKTFFNKITKPSSTITTQAPFNLQRFLDAQENNFTDALREIKPFSLHKNTQQNTAKTLNKMPQKCAILNVTKIFKYLHISK